MEKLTELIGKGPDLSALQISVRTVVVFILCLLFLRMSGRRAFGMRMPIDNVLTILLGAILSRAVTGASPFFPTILAGALIVVLYKICSWLSVYSHAFGKLVKGEEKTIYVDGKLLKESMKKCMVTEKDLHEELRINVNLDSFEKIDRIYLERNGEISVVLKEKKNTN